MSTMTDPRTMEAGPELDALIAIEVMGWKPHHYSSNPDVMKTHPHYDPHGIDWWVDADGRDHSNRWSPSIDWSAAGQVLDAMRQRRLFLCPLPSRDGWSVTAWHGATLPDHDRAVEHAQAETGPLCISRAALLAVRWERDPNRWAELDRRLSAQAMYPARQAGHP